MEEGKVTYVEIGIISCTTRESMQIDDMVGSVRGTASAVVHLHYR